MSEKPCDGAYNRARSSPPGCLVTVRSKTFSTARQHRVDAHKAADRKEEWETMPTTPKRPKAFMSSLGASIIIASLFIKAAAIRKAEGRSAQ
jgi:hypothetical protein